MIEIININTMYETSCTYVNLKSNEWYYNSREVLTEKFWSLGKKGMCLIWIFRFSQVSITFNAFFVNIKSFHPNSTIQGMIIMTTDVNNHECIIFFGIFYLSSSVSEWWSFNDISVSAMTCWCIYLQTIDLGNNFKLDYKHVTIVTSFL